MVVPWIVLCAANSDIDLKGRTKCFTSFDAGYTTIAAAVAVDLIVIVRGEWNRYQFPQDRVGAESDSLHRYVEDA
jgi:hypothetical protein